MLRCQVRPVVGIIRRAAVDQQRKVIESGNSFKNNMVQWKARSRLEVSDRCGRRCSDTAKGEPGSS